METRRRILLALPVLAPASAGAFRFEPPTAEVAADYGASSCTATELHEALQAELSRALDGRPLPVELPPRIAALARCPLCGCSVVGSAGHGEGTGPTDG